LLAACLTRYSDVTFSRLAGDMFGCLPSHRPTSLSDPCSPNPNSCTHCCLYAVALWGCLLMLFIALACVHAPDYDQ
jgi:hypothetical protein